MADEKLDKPKLFRNIIRITAEDSPNVKFARAQESVGIHPDNTIIIPDVLTWQQYVERRNTMDIEQQTVALDAQFYQGAAIMLFPEEWLNYSYQLADNLVSQRTKRTVKAIGIDPAEGGDRTSMCAVDDYGIVELISKKTPNTDTIYHEALNFMLKHNIPPDRVIFDRGGGGKQHADRIRAQGYPVKAIGFGEKIGVEPKRGIRLFRDKVTTREESFVYFNRRAQLYGTLSDIMDPSFAGFAIPRRYSIIRDQLRVIPKMYVEGRLKLPPKNRTSADDSSKKEKTLVELIGYSPDEADSLVLAVYGMLNRGPAATAGAIT